MASSLYRASETMRRMSAIMEYACSLEIRATILRVGVTAYSKKQQLGALNHISEALDQIWSEVVGLMELYQQQTQKPDCAAVLETVSHIRPIALKAEERVRESQHFPRRSCGEIREVLDYLLKELRSLREDAYSLAQESANCIAAMMPIPLSQGMADTFTYDQIRLNPQSAIQHAFSVFEEHLRTKLDAGADTYGPRLINAAFGNDGSLTYGEMPNEQQGVRNLMAGAYALLRNPRVHRIVEDSESSALAAIALIDMMIQIVDQAQKKDLQEA